jgi:integrase
MAGLPKNIGLVQYKNTDGTKQVKYRVRITIKDTKFDQLFDELDQAKSYLFETKSHFGRKAIAEADIAEEKAFAEFKSPTFEWFFDLYFKWKHPSDFDQNNLLKKKQHSTYKSFFKTIAKTQFKVFNEDVLTDTPHAAQLISSLGFRSNISEKTSLAELKLHEINYKTINAYIKTRLKLVSKITVRKEISVLSCFFKDLKYVDGVSLKSIEDLKNPCKEIDSRLLANAKNLKKAKRISNDDLEKLKVCIENEPIDFGYACMLQYLGAFRMSEMLSLTWENINFETKEIFLPQTKTNPRTVLMTSNLEELLNKIEADKEKRTGIVLKTQTLYKYQKQIQRYRVKYGFNLTTHRFRKHAISTMIDAVGNKQDNAIVLAKILGYTNVKQFSNDYIDEKPDTNTMAGILKVIGHTANSINITANNYHELEKINIGKAADSPPTKSNVIEFKKPR